MTNCDITLVLILILILCFVLIFTWTTIEKLRKKIKWQDERINAMWESIDDRYTRMLREWDDAVKTVQELTDTTSELIDTIKGRNNHDSE